MLIFQGVSKTPQFMTKNIHNPSHQPVFFVPFFSEMKFTWWFKPWPFWDGENVTLKQGVKWPPTRGWKGHFESPGRCCFPSCHLLEIRAASGWSHSCGPGAEKDDLIYTWIYMIFRRGYTLGVHPGGLTWTIIMEVWKIIFLSKWVICRWTMLFFQGVSPTH